MKRQVAIAACAALAGTAAWADGPDLRFSGYGTVGAVVTDTNDSQFVASPRQSKGADKSADIGVDSRLGAQANLTFNPTFSAVGQLLASRLDGKNTPRIEWLYAQAKPFSGLDLRVGRMVLPLFLVSDSRNVGYASHWLRAPVEVYGLAPTTSFDGLQAQSRAEWAGINFTLQASAGKAKYKSYPAFTLDVENNSIRSLNVVAERGDLTLRLGRTQNDVKISGLPFPAPVAKDVFSGVGLQYDNGRVLLMSEYVQRRQDTRGGDANAYYLSGGYRFGGVMPYATVSRFVPKGTSYPSLVTTGTDAIGVRWDVMPKVALKAQFESTTPSTQFVNSSFVFLATSPKVQVFSLAADFVF